ncbi:hypothetical protein, variant [Salpingoeca rosetta]|nr:hypothetical protein, variant [Salpingoeca rosetta]EGD81250.1 hypothetical protein, variant [Salpingoeca rosetta]|eukprot:XP_004987646.1 hypothetical protein, variant [Salpingoeca rosetta]
MAAGTNTHPHSHMYNGMAFNGNISTFDLWDTEVSRALAAMCSYASINGVPSPCANDMLFNDVVRRQWKRDMALNRGADMKLGETYCTTNSHLEQDVQQDRTTIDTVHNAASMSARPADPSLTSSNGRCISKCPDGEYELGQRSCIAHCPLDWLLRQGPPLRAMHHVWHGHLGLHPMLRILRRCLFSPWTECKPGQKESVSGNAYQPLPDRASCFPTSVCEEPLIETIPPTLTTDRLCSCDTLTCNNLITQLFEEMVCAEPTDESFDVVLDVCCSGQGEDGIRNTIRQMDAYEAGRSCPGCTDTCECSAGFILVYDADSAGCRPCNGVTEFSPSIGGSKCEPIQDRCSLDRVCRDCPACTIDSDSDGSTGCHMCPSRHYTEAGSHGSARVPTTIDSDPTPPPRATTSQTARPATASATSARRARTRLSGQGVPCLPVTTCDAGEEETAEPTPTSDRVCSQCELGATFKPCGPDEEEIRFASPRASTTASAASASRTLACPCRVVLPRGRPRSTPTASARPEVVGALVAHIGTGQAQEVDAATPVLLLSLATDDPKLLHPFALMLNGTLDCLSTLHFIHILQLFCVLTTLMFDRQRTAAAGLIHAENEDGLSQSNEELKCIGTIAATTVTHTWLALANAADISIDGAFVSNSYQEQAHLSGCVNGDGGLTIDPPPPQPYGFRSLADPGRHVCAGIPKRTFQHNNSLNTIVREDAAGAVRDEAAAAVGDCRRVRGHSAQKDRRGDKTAEARCRNADLFTFLMSLQPFVWWDLSLGTGDLNPEEETVEEVQHESWAHPRAHTGVPDGRGPAATTCCSARSGTDSEYILATQPFDKAAGCRAH